MSVAPAEWTKKTIVVVDDEFDIAEAVQSLLQAEGYQVLVYPDGRTALEGLATYPGQVSLVLADVMMPRMDGVKLLESLRRERAFGGVPMVIMSALRPKGRPDAPPPWNAFLQKPFSFGTLLRTVQKQIGAP
ncbi:MAG TPA: response regulator [Myxococcaceae bacterium]|nr:response regulator [Myxococcaceae bacterium]